MDFDELLRGFFGTDDLASLPEAQLVAGMDRLRLQFGIEKDDGRRFALWCLMYMLGDAPDLDVAFKRAEDRDAARDFMDMVESEADEDD